MNDMLDRFNESELLAYIEDELDPRQRAALEQRLAAAPKAAALVQRMKEDRILLRSVKAPAPPMDFLAELEPRLARPMLIDTSPGAYRRQHRRGRRLRPVPMVAAAVLLLLTGAAMWVGLSSGLESGRSMIAGGADDGTGTAGVDTPASSPDSIAVAPPATGGDTPAPSAVDLHHFAPVPEAAVGDRTANGPGVEPLPDLPGAPFTLVLHVDDVDEVVAAERLLLQVLEEIAGPTTDAVSTALVRNLSDAEVAEVMERLALETRPGTAQPDVTAGVDGRSGARNVDAVVGVREDPRVRRAVEQARAEHREADDAWFSKQLLGPESASPSYETQLELSRRGATHTLSTRIDRLSELLVRLHAIEHASVSLRPHQAEEDAPDEETTALQRWVEDFRALRTLLVRLRASGQDDASIHVPIVIEE